MAGPLSNVGDFVEGKIFIDGQFGGFSESYKFRPDIDIISARTVLGNIIKARGRLLAKNHSILRGVVSQWSVNRDKHTPLGTSYSDYQPRLIGSEMAIEECNSTGTGLLYRFDSGVGKFANRLLRGVRDSWITANASTLGAFTDYALNAYLGGGPTPAYTDPVAAADLIGNYLAYVRDVTAIYVYDLASAPNVWIPYTFDSVQYRRVGSHDTGKRNSVSKGKKSVMS